MLSNKSRCHSAITIKLRLGTFFLILSQKLLEAPSKGQEMNVHREEFRDVEREVVANSDITQPVSDQIVQPQNKFLTPVIWAAAAVILTISLVEFGGLSIGNLVRDLLASNL